MARQLTIPGPTVLNQAVDADNKNTIKGSLERLKFTSEDGEFSVAMLQTESGEVTVVGNLMATKVGEHVEATGRWHTDNRFGKQFRIEAIKSVAPTSLAGIERYLSSGLIEGIGKVLAERIVSHFGAETLEIIDADPSRIREVPGIGKKRATSIADAWGEQRLIRNVMVFLQSHGVTPAYAARIWKAYGTDAVELIRQNPYRLAAEIRGIGFKSADSIARSMGLDRDSPHRIAAGVRYVLDRAQTEGHCYLEAEDLRGRAVTLLGVESKQIDDVIGMLRTSQELIVESLDNGMAVYPKQMWTVETDLASQLRALSVTARRFQIRSVEHRIDDAETSMGVELADQQRQAVQAVFDHKISVITGGPGTGKTTIINAIVNIAKQLKQRVALAAPTGRAAKRLSEAADMSASTIHRLLEFNPHAGGFTYNRDNPLTVDLVIVDEASMVDLRLMNWLVAAMPADAGLVLVGDIDQLPSVGAGNVLRDIIDSKAVNVTRLEFVFRQGSESTIVTNAHRINHGELPIDPDRDGLVDFYTIKTNDPEVAADRIQQLIEDRIPNAFGLDPLNDVQVLSPMHKGAAGTAALNRRLQEAMRKEGAIAYKRGDNQWIEGDKVMQIRNNYDRAVFNGDIGQIHRIDRMNKKLTVNFDDQLVNYAFNDLDELVLAYAITIHKSQGSEYPAVVIPILNQHYVMLQRNLLYTAITRARQLVILVGSPQAISMAVRSNESVKRNSRLAARLRG